MRYKNFLRGTEIHPDVLWIAVNLILHPEDRPLYTPVVLSLADGAIEMLKERLASGKGVRCEELSHEESEPTQRRRKRSDYHGSPGSVHPGRSPATNSLRTLVSDHLSPMSASILPIHPQQSPPQSSDSGSA